MRSVLLGLKVQIIYVPMDCSFSYANLDKTYCLCRKQGKLQKVRMNTKDEMRNAKCEMQNAKCKMRNQWWHYVFLLEELGRQPFQILSRQQPCHSVEMTSC